MMRNSYIILPALGKKTRMFHILFTRPGKVILEVPCISNARYHPSRPFAGAPSAKGGNSPNAKCENRWDDVVCERKRRHGLCNPNPRKSRQWNLESKQVISGCKKACGLPPCPKRTEQPKRQSQGCNCNSITHFHTGDRGCANFEMYTRLFRVSA